MNAAGSSRFFPVLALLACAVMFVPVARSQVPPSSVIEPFQQALSAAESDAARAQIAEHAASEAMLLTAQGSPSADTLMRFAASVFASAGRRDDALSCLELVAAGDGSAFDRASAWRMMGDLLSRNDAVGAEAAYRNQIATLPLALKTSIPALSGRRGLAKALRDQKRFAEAVDEHTRILSDFGNRLSDAQRVSISVESGRDSFALGDAAAGLFWFDRVFQEFPRWGEGEVTAVALRLEAIKQAHTLSGDRAAYGARLLALWQNDSLSKNPYSLLIGHELVLLHAKDATMRDIYILDVIDRYRLNGPNWRTELSATRAGKTVEKILESDLRWLCLTPSPDLPVDVVLDACLDFLDLFPDSPHVPDVHDRISKHSN